MMKQIRVLTILFVMALSSVANAQFVSPVDFMRNNPRSNSANPAFYTPEFGYFDLLLGGINFGVQNIGLKYDNFFRFNQYGQPVALDLNQGVASLNNENFINTYLNFDIFNCGRRTSHGYITFWHRIREVESLYYSKDLMQFLVHGNGYFLGESHPADIQLGLAARAYQEIALGYQMSLTEHLNIGIRFKFLMGLIDAKVNANAKLYTDPDTYALKLMAMANANATVPYPIELTDGLMPKIVDGRFNVANLFKNYGGGVDLGVEYMINDQFGVAAAVNDLGAIRWNNFSLQYDGGLQDGGSYYEDGAFHFSGVTSEQVQNLINDPGSFSNFADTVMNYINMTGQTIEGYTTPLNTNFMVRGYFNANSNHRFSAQFTGYNLGMGIKPAATLAYTGSFNDKYDVVATYTVMPGCYDNIGIGLSANFGGLMLFVATNNVLAFFNPANSSAMSIQTGLSFTGGTLIDRSETVIIRDKNRDVYDDDDEE